MNALKRLKRNPEILPLVGIVSFACGMGVFFLSRAATRYPEVAWDHKTNPSPYLDIKANEQRKLYSTVDYEKFKDERPKL